MQTFFGSVKKPGRLVAPKAFAAYAALFHAAESGARRSLQALRQRCAPMGKAEAILL